MSQVPTPPPEVEKIVYPFLSSIQKETLVAAVAGSLILLLLLGEKVTWKIATAAIFTGALSAYYLVGIIAQSFHLDQGWCGALGAGIGICALPVLGGVVKLLRMFRDDPWGSIQKVLPIFGKRGGG
jgi:hypothetical protein